MAIKTTHNIELEIDEKKFAITVSTLTKAQRDELNEIAKGFFEVADKQRPIQAEINELAEEYAINKEILAHANVIEKLKVVFEQKSLYKQILAKQQELKDVEGASTDFSASYSSFFSKKFDLIVSGEGKAALKKEMEDKEISYQTIIAVIEASIAPSKEKK